MSKIRLAADDIKHITLFESMTNAKVKDFIREGELMCFLVNSGEMGLAIGKKGAKVERMRAALGKNILILEHNDDPEIFLKNMLHPAEIHGTNIAKTSGGISAQIVISREDRSKAIGPGGSKIRLIKALAKRHHNIDDLSLKTI